MADSDKQDKQDTPDSGAKTATKRAPHPHRSWLNEDELRDHLVMPGDTPTSLAHFYFGGADRAAEIMHANPGSAFTAGSVVKIPPAVHYTARKVRELRQSEQWRGRGEGDAEMQKALEAERDKRDAELADKESA